MIPTIFNFAHSNTELAPGLIVDKEKPPIQSLSSFRRVRMGE